MRKLRWDHDEQPLPKHPYRDSAIIYGALAVLVVVLGAATGTSVVKSVIVAVAVFVAATLYSWWRWHTKLRKSGESRR